MGQGRATTRTTPASGCICVAAGRRLLSGGVRGPWGFIDPVPPAVPVRVGTADAAAACASERAV